MIDDCVLRCLMISRLIFCMFERFLLFGLVFFWSRLIFFFLESFDLFWSFFLLSQSGLRVACAVCRLESPLLCRFSGAAFFTEKKEKKKKSVRPW